MSEIYIFAPDNDDYSTIGECGALDASSCLFEEVANGESELTLEHPLDALGKFRYLQAGAVLKAEVPVRTTPEIRNGRFVTSVEQWTVKGTATKAERYVYSKASGGKKKKLLKAGAAVVVTSKPSDGSRWKIKSGKTSGWIASAALESQTTVTIPDAPDGMENAAPAWECREQLFRIYKVNRSDTGITANARHISYDLMYNLTTYDVDTEVQLQDALDGVLDACLDPHEFAAYTDIRGSRTGVHAADKNPVEVMLDPEEGLAAAWGAQLVRDDFELYLLSRAGGNRGLSIEYAKNLTGVDVDEDLSSVATCIRPIGEKKNGKPLYLEENGGLIESPLAGNYPFRRIQVLECENCKAGKGGVTEDIARARMKEQAQALFDQGVDRPTISAKVTFAQLGRSERYARYRDLENVYLYDEVQVRHPILGVDITTQVVRAIWDCLRGRMTSIELGSLQALTPSVAGWQISGGISGSKLSPGSVGSSQLGDDSISTRHVQADSINAEAIQADAVTSDKIAANAILARHIAAGAIEATTVKALEAYLSEITAGSITTDELAAQLARLQVLIAGVAEFDRATIQHLVAEAMHLQFGEMGEVFISNLAVGYAQMVGAAIGDLVIKSADGRYYHLDVDQSGCVTATEVSVSEGEAQAGQTGDGKVILGTDITAEDLHTTNLFATFALVNRIDAARIDVDELFAREAFVTLLRTCKIVGDTTLELLVRDAERDVRSVDVEYYLSTSPSAAIGDEWSADPPQSVPEGRYLWHRTKCTTAGGSVYYAGTECLTSASGTQGPPGVGIEAIEEHYAASNSATVAPSDWYDSPQAMDAEHRFLWNYETFRYTDGSSKDTLKRVIGACGEAGAPGSKGADGEDGRGILDITNYYLATSASSGVSRSAYGWTSAVQSPAPDARYLWNYEEIHYSDNSYSYTNPCVIGVYGEKGADGSRGRDGRGITAVREQYYLSTSAEAPSGGEWLDEQPAWEEEHYLWTRTVIRYDDGSTEETEGFLANALNSANSAASGAQSTADGLSEQLGQVVSSQAEMETYLKLVPGEGVYVGYPGGNTRAFINQYGLFEVLVGGESVTAMGPGQQRIGKLIFQETENSVYVKRTS